MQKCDDKTKKLRKDGRETTERLLLCTAKLTAVKGFAAVTSKEICLLAGTNLAAVNYHFGSREGLYEALIAYVHNQMVSENLLKELVKSPQTPKEKLDAFLNNLLRFRQANKEEEGYHLAVQVWLKECFNNTEVILPVLQKIAAIKLPWLVQLFAEYTGRSYLDKALFSGILSFVAPFILLNMGTYIAEAGVHSSLEKYVTEDFIQNMKKFAFAGLASLKI